MDGSDLSLFCLSEKDLEMLTNFKSDQQFSILSYGKGGPTGKGGDLVSDFNPIAIMHPIKMDKVRTDNKQVNKRLSSAIR